MEYYNEDNLYEYFKASIKEESSKKMNRLRLEIDDIIKKELAIIEVEEKRKIDWSLGSVLREIKNDHQTQLNTIEVDINSKLMLRRREMFDELFKAITNLIKEYVLSDDYQENMNNLLKEIVLSKEEIEFIVNDDSRLIASINKQFGNKAKITIKPLIGGFIAIIPSRGIEIDETMEARLEKVRLGFYSSAKLFIE